MTLLRLLGVGVMLGMGASHAIDPSLYVPSVCGKPVTWECTCASGTAWRFTQDGCGRVEPPEAIGTIRIRDRDWCLACVAELFDAAGAQARRVEDCHE